MQFVFSVVKSHNTTRNYDNYYICSSTRSSLFIINTHTHTPFIKFKRAKSSHSFSSFTYHTYISSERFKRNKSYYIAICTGSCVQCASQKARLKSTASVNTYIVLLLTEIVTSTRTCIHTYVRTYNRWLCTRVCCVGDCSNILRGKLEVQWFALPFGSRNWIGQFCFCLL